MRKLLLPVVLMFALLCGCAEVSEAIETNLIQASDVEAILTAVVENIDWEQLQAYAEKGAEALIEKYPSLKVLTDSEQMKDLLKDKGLTLAGKLLQSTEPEIQENAHKIGQIIKILYPDLTQDVDAVLGS